MSIESFRVCATCIHFQAEKKRLGMSYYCKRLGYNTKPNYKFNCWTPKKHIQKLMEKRRGEWNE